MVFIEWTDALSVGVPDIDADHKLLVSLINQLNDSIGDPEEQATLGSVLNTLVDYTVYHFAREEKVMEACGFPGLENHKKQHAALTDKVLAVQSSFLAEEEGVVTANVLDFLKEWLTTHILKQDMEYRGYAEGNDAAAEAARTVKPLHPGGGAYQGEKAEFDWRQLKILIVDDNRNFRNVSRTILQAAQVAEIEEASSGQEALDKLGAFRPDVILCDWRMEGMDGIEFVEKLRDTSSSPAPGVPVVMMTGFGGDEFEKKAAAAGVTRFMEKPITPRALLVAVVQAVT